MHIKLDKFLCTLRKLLYWITIFVFTKKLFEIVFQSKKQIDFGDESIILIGAAYPSGHRTFLYGAEWILRPLYNFSNNNLSEFRIYGAQLIFFGGVFISSRLIAIFSADYIDGTLPKNLKLLFVIAGGLVSLNYYQAFARSPNYNWLNYISLLTALIAMTYILNKNQARNNFLDLPIIFYSLGISISLFSKPTTPILLLILHALIRIRLGWKIYLHELIKICLYTFFFLVSFIVTKVIPINFYTILFNKFRSPPIAPEHSLLGGTFDIFRMLTKIPYYLNLQEKIILVLLILFLILFLPKITLFFECKNILLFFGLIILLFLSNLYYRFRFTGLNFDVNSLLTISLTMVCVLLLMLIAIRFFNRGYFYGTNSDSNSKSLILFLIGCTYIYSFGSTDGYFHKYSEFIGFIYFIMLIKILELKLDYNSFRSLVASIVLVSIATFFVTFSYSFTKQSFSFSTYEISFSHSKTNNVFVKPSEGVQLLHLREISKKNGLNSSTPLINLASPGYSYFLGANVPNSSHLTFFDREKSIDLFKFQVYKSNQSFNYSNAWILRFAPQFGSSLANYQSIQALKIIENVSHLKFPDNYVLIYSDASLQLWKPLPSSFKYNNLNSINVSRYPLEVSRHYR